MRALAPTTALLLGLSACANKGADSAQPELGGTPPGWSLIDENPASPSAGEERGPPSERGRVSAWYFGHST